MQKQSEYSNRRAEIEHENLKSLCLELLGSALVVDTDYVPENEGDPIAYRTEDYSFMFVPQMDDPVMSGRTLLGQKPIPGKYRYSVEVGVSSGGSYWEPPDYDQVEIGREDSLSKCIGIAAHYLLDQKIQGIQEDLYWGMESKLNKEFSNLLNDY
jgi:hypothetical protein